MTAPGPDSVEAFLRANPGFLAERPGLYAALLPPRRHHDERLADHMAAMLAVERRARAALEQELGRQLDHARAQQDFAARIGRAVLALMGTRAPLQAITEELPGLLGIESCTLAAEAPPRAHVRALPAGSVQRLIGAGRSAVVRDEPDHRALLHGEQASLIARDALVRVPGAEPMLMALGARDPAALPASHAAAQLVFLGHAVEVALWR